MKSLFVRIFLWFWITLAVVAALLVVSSPFFTRSRPRFADWERQVETRLRGRLTNAAKHLENGGPQELDRGPRRGRRHEARRPPNSRLWILRPDGTDVMGEAPPPPVVAIGVRAMEGGDELSERSGVLHLVARPVVSADGQPLVVVAAAHLPPRLVDLIEPRAIAVRLLALFLVAAALCFWLARYLTAPVSAVRQTARKLAEGRLESRVGPPVNVRRDEIGDLARDFDTMAARVEALVEGQERLLRDVSHELRSPLARIAVALELARKHAPETATRSLDRIGLETGRIDDLVGQLLTLNRLRYLGPLQDPEPVDLAEVVREVAEDASFEAQSRQVAVDVEGRQDQPCVVMGRPELLRSAIDNVVRNAIRHSPSGERVEIRLGGDRHTAELVVRDHGPGVADDALPHLFEPFYRAESARDRQRGGVGLGLAITEQAIRTFGGSVRAGHADGGGLEVRILLSLESPA